MLRVGSLERADIQRNYQRRQHPFENKSGVLPRQKQHIFRALHPETRELRITGLTPLSFQYYMCNNAYCGCKDNRPPHLRALLQSWDIVRYGTVAGDRGSFEEVCVPIADGRVTGRLSYESATANMYPEWKKTKVGSGGLNTR